MSEKRNDAKHSPTPWMKGYIPKSGAFAIYGQEYDRIAIFESLGETGYENASYIVECVNAHERLVAENARLRAVLKACLNDMRFDLCLYDDIPSRRRRIEADMAEARAALGEEAGK